MRKDELPLRDKREGVEAKMITVSIYINDRPIFTRSARNVTENIGQKIHSYLLDTGETIRHKRALGAVPLAIKMLKTKKEP
jgi:hypothetical protein